MPVSWNKPSTATLTPADSSSSQRGVIIKYGFKKGNTQLTSCVFEDTLIN